MDPMFLPDVERSPAPGPWANAIRLMRDRGAEYPQIWHLFAYLPGATAASGQVHAGDPARTRAAQSRAS